MTGYFFKPSHPPNLTPGRQSTFTFDKADNLLHTESALQIRENKRPLTTLGFGVAVRDPKIGADQGQQLLQHMVGADMNQARADSGLDMAIAEMPGQAFE
jgi:hypothetical protein